LVYNLWTAPSTIGSHTDWSWLPCDHGANIINYKLFHVNYDAQLSRDKILTIYGIIHRYIYISYAIKLRKLPTLKNDNIGPSEIYDLHAYGSFRKKILRKKNIFKLPKFRTFHFQRFGLQTK
jgi:hypothetical protein